MYRDFPGLRPLHIISAKIKLFKKKKKRCSKGVLLDKSIIRYADDCHLLTNIRQMNDISETSRLWNTTKFLFKGIFGTMLLKFLQYTVI